MRHVLMYSSTVCPFCMRAEMLLKQRGVTEVEKIMIDRTDGARVTTADGWWLLRASNTQDVLVARAEAANEAALGRLMAQINAALAASGVAAVSTGLTSPRMLWRIRSTISSKTISRCSMVRCRASWAVMIMVEISL